MTSAACLQENTVTISFLAWTKPVPRITILSERNGEDRNLSVKSSEYWQGTLPDVAKGAR
jgi:hypothetical protein